MHKNAMREQACAVLRENDRGTYTVPTKGLYPFQWNWDSCLTALGQSWMDEARAWTEIETLLAHQWPDGMVPHIVFHVDDAGYFPGPDVWRTNRPVKTSGITQPAVAGFAVRRLFGRAQNRKLAEEKARLLLPKIDRWHQWFFDCRDPQGEGLVAVLHPWESGRDNAVDWDEPFSRVPTDGIDAYERRDLKHADASQRPTKEQYDRYLWLLQCFRALDWDNTKLHAASPFQVVDPGFNAILFRSCADIADLAEELGMEDIAAANRRRATRGLAALEKLWSEKHGQYLCLDRTTGKLIDSASSGGLLPVFADIGADRARAIARKIEELSARAEFLVPSHDPADPRFDAKRYWRGPVWLVVNYMICDGLRAAGEGAAADKVAASSLALIERGGFAEYYDPHTGAPYGGARFTWTAAMVLEFLHLRQSA